MCNREALWLIREKKYQLPGKLTHILRALHRDNKGAVRAYGKLSKEFPINIYWCPVQGDVLAPVLFNLFFDAVIAATLSHHKDSGFKVLYNIGDPLVGSRKKMKNEVDINDLEYADDMAIISDSMALWRKFWEHCMLSVQEWAYPSAPRKPESWQYVHPAYLRACNPDLYIQLSPDSVPVAVVEHIY